MKIPVFLALHADDELLKSPLSARFARDAQSAVQEDFRRRFERLSLDYTFDAIPVGLAITRRIVIPEPATDEALLHYLAVRGSMEVDNVNLIPETLGGNPVLADPVVDTYLTCFNDNPVGTAEEVAARLNLAALHAQGMDGDGVAIAVVDTGINLNFLEQKLGFRPELDTAYSWRPPA